MKREDLKTKGLTDEQIDFVMAENGKDVEANKSKITTAQAELETAKNQLTEANKQIEGFKSMNIDQIKASADDYKAKFEKAQSDGAAQVAKLKFDHTLDDALKSAKAKDVVSVRAHLNTDQLKLNEADGSIVGLNDQLEKVKKEKGYLFEAEGNPPPTIVTGAHNQSIFKSGDVVIDAARKAAGLPPLAGDK